LHAASETIIRDSGRNVGLPFSACVDFYPGSEKGLENSPLRRCKFIWVVRGEERGRLR